MTTSVETALIYSTILVGTARLSTAIIGTHQARGVAVEIGGTDD